MALRKHLNVLRKALTSHTVGAFEVAEACLAFATRCTRDKHPFDSSAWRNLDVAGPLGELITSNVNSVMDSEVVKKIVDLVAGSEDPPLAAWVAAQHISMEMWEDFSAFSRDGSLYTLRDLQGFAVPATAATTLYGKSTALSAKPGARFRQNNPSAVDGLALWRDDPSLHGPYTVVVDKTCGEQFDLSLGDNNTLKVALIQPDHHLMELCVAEVSPASDRNPRFFGVKPADEAIQMPRVLNGLRLAAAAGAGIALLPELAMTEGMAAQVVAELGKPGNIIPPTADPHTLRVVVSGSYHHRDANNKKRNTTQVHFPRRKPTLTRQHSKSGTFIFSSPQVVMEAWSCDPRIHGPARAALASASKTKVDFREDVAPMHTIRLFSGVKFSAVVVICADVLNETLRTVLKTLQPSLVLVCNMSEKLDDFNGVAHELVVACQSTLASVNNPAFWASRVPGALVGMPLRLSADRVLAADFPDATRYPKGDYVMIFDPRAKPPLQTHPIPPS